MASAPMARVGLPGGCRGGDGPEVAADHNGWVSIRPETRCARSGAIGVLVYEALPVLENPGDRGADGTWP
jgi:hypothetical protein